MDTKSMTVVWGGINRDVVSVIPAYKTSGFGGDASDHPLVSVYRILDENEESTDEIVGVEIVDFLDFDEWSSIPDLPELWSINGREGLRPVEALRTLQAEFRAHARIAKAS